MPLEITNIVNNENTVISYILSKQAKERPNSPAIQWQNEEPITYKELYDKCLHLAGGLKTLNVKPKDNVLIMLPNSIEIILSWFSINFLGAVQVPINIHYKEKFLIHETNDCQARIAIIHSDYVQKFV